MFEDLGKTLKTLSVIILIIGLIFTIITSISQFVTAANIPKGGGFYAFLGILTLILGVLASFTIGFVLCAIGEIHQISEENNSMIHNTLKTVRKIKCDVNDIKKQSQQ